MTYDEARKAVILALGEHQLTIPMARGMMALIDLREEAGVKLPETWAELVNAALGSWGYDDGWR
jgi:hypothetical protein